MNIVAKTAAVAALALAAGCVDTAGTRVDIDTETGDASVTECSPRLARRVRVYDVIYGASGDIKTATVKIESKTRRRISLQARMVWMDAEGVEIDPDAKPFRTIVLDGLDVKSISGVAPNARAVKARLQIRETRTVK